MFESYQYYKSTRSVCPTCRTLVPAKIVFVDRNVYMLKVCSQHGEFRSLIERDSERYLESLSISKPALIPLEFTHTSFDGCGYSCGICPEHQQHTCLPIIEITDYCNFSCPICLVENSKKTHMGTEEFASIIDSLIRVEGTLDLINISGGEPTMHPELISLIDRARRKEITNISISTNGRAFLENRFLLEGLVKRGVYISLQFDGFDSEIYRAIRGEDLLEEKLHILELLEQACAKTSLVMTVIRGINDHQIGQVVDFVLEKNFIKSLMIQPIAFTNSEYKYDEAKVETTSDIANELTKAKKVSISKDDVTPLPCSHPSCFSLMYLLKLEGGGYVPLTHLVDVNSYLNVIQNRTTPGLDGESFEKIRDNIYELWSASGSQPESEKILATVRNLICELGKCGRNPSPQSVFTIAENNIKSIFIHSFMDPYNFDLARAMKCCNQYPVHRDFLPCCFRNVIKRRN